MCPDREILSAYLDGEIGPPWDKAIGAHVAACPTCRAAMERLEKTRRILQEEPIGEWKEPMERVRRAILTRVPPMPGPIPAWRRQVSLPLPLAVLAAVLLIALGVSSALSFARTNVGFIKITKAPAGGTEYQFAVPVDKVEALLKSVGGGDTSLESVLTLPKNVKLVPVGAPRMGKETEFPRKRP
jgi:predicted anti-sigma-YlaC factor YlaD